MVRTLPRSVGHRIVEGRCRSCMRRVDVYANRMGACNDRGVPIPYVRVPDSNRAFTQTPMPRSVNGLPAHAPRHFFQLRFWWAAFPHPGKEVKNPVTWRRFVGKGTYVYPSWKVLFLPFLPYLAYCSLDLLL